MEVAKELGVLCVSHRTVKETDAVMFDIDETLIHVDGTPIPEMISLLQLCRKLRYTVIVITARPDTLFNHYYTKWQLISFGIFPHQVYFVPPSEKIAVKKQTKLHYILSIGDLWTDLDGSDYWIKLPDTTDSNIYSNINVS